MSLTPPRQKILVPGLKKESAAGKSRRCGSGVQALTTRGSVAEKAKVTGGQPGRGRGLSSKYIIPISASVNHIGVSDTHSYKDLMITMGPSGQSKIIFASQKIPSLTHI